MNSHVFDAETYFHFYLISDILDLTLYALLLRFIRAGRKPKMNVLF
jgi:hypothetical protein